MLAGVSRLKGSASGRQARVIKHPLVAFVSQRCYWPYLVLSVVIAIVHQLSGSNAINFYGPQLFATMGHGKKASLLNSVILGAGELASRPNHPHQPCSDIPVEPSIIFGEPSSSECYALVTKSAEV